MAQRDNFRTISNFDLRPVFISLGLPESSFKAAAFPRRTALFDAALNADPSRPDTLWLFKGSNYFAFNLLTGSFEGDAKQIAGNWGGSSWPLMFSTGIDGAVWGQGNRIKFGPRFLAGSYDPIPPASVWPRCPSSPRFLAARDSRRACGSGRDSVHFRPSACGCYLRP